MQQALKFYLEEANVRRILSNKKIASKKSLRNSPMAFKFMTIVCCCSDWSIVAIIKHFIYDEPLKDFTLRKCAFFCGEKS